MSPANGATARSARIRPADSSPHLLRCLVAFSLGVSGTLVPCAIQGQDSSSRLADLLPLAAAGDADAECRLGTYYSEGPESKRDFDQARLWLGKAAEQGNPEAQRRLGRLCRAITSR